MAIKWSAFTAGSAIGGTNNLVGLQSSANVLWTFNQAATFFWASPTLVTPALGTPSSGTLTNCTGLQVVGGGTGLSSASQGDLLYGSAANTLSALAKDTNATRYLANTGTSNNPAWAQVALGTGVSGTLGTANGGTGVANNAASTLTISGNFATTLTVTNTTGVTLPVSGTLATTAVATLSSLTTVGALASGSIATGFGSITTANVITTTNATASTTTSSGALIVTGGAGVGGAVNAGSVKVASGGALTLGNAATTGLTAGVLAALTNATIVITDSAGQEYRIPCII